LTGRGVFVAGAAGGALIWLVSPVVTGYREPWDSPGPYYALSLGGLGIMLGALAPRLFWLAPLAGFCGQFVVFASRALLPPEELWPLGLTVLVIYAGIIAVGALVGALGRLGGSRLQSWVRQHRLPAG
jgi:hypothetical protein